MDDQKRALLAIALIVGFLYFWTPQYFASGPRDSTVTPTQVEQVERTSEASEPSKATAEATTAMLQNPKRQEVAKKTSEVSTALYDLRFSNVTGGPVKAHLKNYRKSLKGETEPVEVLPFMGQSVPISWGFRLGETWIGDRLETYELVQESDSSLTYRKELAEGLWIEKSYTWPQNAYLIEHHVRVTNRRSASLGLEARISMEAGTTSSETQSMFHPGDPLSAIAYINEKSVRMDIETVFKQEEVPKGDLQWVGFDSRYFLFSALPKEGKWKNLAFQVYIPEGGKNEAAGVERLKLDATYPQREIGPGQSVDYQVELYIGPKDIGLLTNVGSSLERTIDLGDWLGPIARPILSFLRKLHTVVPNYGVAIILLTFLVRLLLFPLTQMQAKSMRKMQDHKPQMDALKEKFKDNKEAYSKELMTYMRTHKINPMGGCLLILPQFPIFISLYRVLYNSIELRHAPFMFWIQDLSAKDPYFVMPVILGGVMFVQQKMTPTPGMDSNQAAMMKFMPVMFGFFMLFLPAGLNLYILVSTVWGIAQQYWVQKRPNVKTAMGKN